MIPSRTRIWHQPRVFNICSPCHPRFPALTKDVRQEQIQGNSDYPFSRHKNKNESRDNLAASARRGPAGPAERKSVTSTDGTAPAMKIEFPPPRHGAGLMGTNGSLDSSHAAGIA